jgi:hypothetical protein
MNRPFIICVSILFLACSSIAAQSKSRSGAAAKSGSSSTASSPSASSDEDAEPPGLGFSIETEMFTYKAVEENSAVVACDVARYLYGGTLENAEKGSGAACVISGKTETTQPGIIIVSSGSTLLTDFQVWRADMATMNDLEMRAAEVCKVASKPPASARQPTGNEQNKGGEVSARGIPGLLMPMAPGEAVSTFGDFLRLFSSSQSISAVGGTVKDQALMNEVARQLRSLNLLVLIPELYNPNNLGAPSYASSPYLHNMEKVFEAYQTCESAKASYTDKSPEAANIDNVMSSLNAFLTLTVQAQSGSKGSDGSSGEVSDAAQSRLAAIYAADGLAQQMGISPDGAAGPSETWQHVLWLKALESGGSVTKDTNLFRTRIRFSGGAVDTYAIFRLDGNLVCSGNVFSFQSPVKLNSLEKSFRAGPLDSVTQSPLLRSTCSALPQASH